MKKIRSFLLVFAFLGAICSPAWAIPGLTWLTPPTSQVWGPYSSWFPPGASGWALTNPVTTTGAAGGSVSVTGSGVARGMTAAGTIIDVPGAITVNVSRSAVAAAAARTATIARGLAGPVGIALTGFALYQAYQNAGIFACPPPDFFCKPDPAQNVPKAADGPWMYQDGDPSYKFQTTQAICDSTKPASTATCNITSSVTLTDPQHGSCYLTRVPIGAGTGCTAGTSFQFRIMTATPAACPTGYHVAFDDINQCNPDSPKLVPATEPDLSNAASNDMGKDNTGGKTKTWYDGMMADQPKISNMGGQPIPGTMALPPGSPTTVNAPSVTGPTATVSKRDYTDSNGVPQSETVTQQPTVTTTSSGTGTSTTITYNITNTYTTTTTTNTSTSTTNPPVVVVTKDTSSTTGNPSTVPQMQLPDDYNREVTQKAILAKLNDAFGPITATAPKGDAELDSIKAQNDQGVAAVAGINETTLGIKGWFPTIPTAACVNPQVHNPITGAGLAVPICDKVDIFRVFISAVVCVFALFGCVREVQSALKA